MSYQVLLNGVDISSKVLKISIKHDDAWQGRLSANEASIELDNTDNAYTLSNLDIEGQTVDIYLNGSKKFTGYAQKPRLNLKTKTVKVVAKDGMIKLMKKKCQDKVFVNTSLDTILLWLVETVGGVSSYSLENTGKTVGFASYSITDKLIDRLQEIVDSVGGQMYFDETGKLIFKAGFLSSFSTSTVGTVSVSKLSDLDFEFIPSKGNKVIVSSKSREASDEKEYIFTWSGKVPAEGMPDGKDDDGNTLANEQWKAQFSGPAIDIDSYSEVEWEADPDLTLDQTTYDSNFDSGNLKYPDFMYLKITNSSNYERYVTKLGIKGKPIKDNNIEAVYQTGSGDVERRVSNDLITGKKWAAQLAQWLYEEGNSKWQVSIPLADFDFALGLSVGDKITLTETSTGLNHRVVVRSIDLKYPESASITVINDRTSAFEYSPSSVQVTSSDTGAEKDDKGANNKKVVAGSAVEMGDGVIQKEITTAVCTISGLSSTGSPEVHLYSSTDNTNWTDEGIISANGDINITKFIGEETGNIFYVKFVEASGAGTQSADFEIKINGDVVGSGSYSLNASETYGPLSLRSKASPGIKVSGADLVVDGEVDTNYLMLNKATAITYSDWEFLNLLYVDVPSGNYSSEKVADTDITFLTSVTINTAKGATTYYHAIPTDVKAVVESHSPFSGDIIIWVLDGTTVLTSKTVSYSDGAEIWIDDIYLNTTMTPSKTLTFNIYLDGTATSDGYFYLRFYTPDVAYMVHIL